MTDEFETVRGYVALSSPPSGYVYAQEMALAALARIEAKRTAPILALEEQSRIIARQDEELQRLRADRVALAERVREACARAACDCCDASIEDIRSVDLTPLLEPK